MRHVETLEAIFSTLEQRGTKPLRDDLVYARLIEAVPVTPDELNDGKAAFPEFHNVYIEPASWRHFEETGEFRDGTILVKELVSIGGKTAVSGNGYFQGEYLGLEASIKSGTHFPDEPGNWAYFSFTSEGGGALKHSAAAFPTASCNACHQAAAAKDWVFSQYYPVLRARSAGE